MSEDTAERQHRRVKVVVTLTEGKYPYDVNELAEATTTILLPVPNPRAVVDLIYPQVEAMLDIGGAFAESIAPPAADAEAETDTDDDKDPNAALEAGLPV